MVWLMENGTRTFNDDSQTGTRAINSDCNGKYAGIRIKELHQTSTSHLLCHPETLDTTAPVYVNQTFIENINRCMVKGRKKLPGNGRNTPHCNALHAPYVSTRRTLNKVKWTDDIMNDITDFIYYD